MERPTIRELVTSLEKELIRMGYAEGTLKYYRMNWKMIIAHFDKIGEDYFSEAAAMEYVDKKCDFFRKEQAGELTQSNIYLFRIIRMMGDFQQHGTVLRRYMRSLSKVNDPLNLEMLDKFGIHCKNSENAISTCKSYSRTAESFLSYTEAQGISLEALNAADLTAFVKTLLGYSYKTVEFILCGTRAFLRFLHSEHVVSADFSESLPNIQTLKVDDVDIEDGAITVTNAKLDKHRQLPVSPEMLLRLQSYHRNVHTFSTADDWFFPGFGGKPMTLVNVGHNFRRFLWGARISHGGRGKGPRVHDFRHTQAVHCLRRWVLEGKDLRAYLPILQAFLGHVSFADTAYYLHLTADLFPDITDKVETVFGFVVPEEGVNDETN